MEMAGTVVAGIEGEGGEVESEAEAEAEIVRV